MILLDTREINSPLFNEKQRNLLLHYVRLTKIIWSSNLLRPRGMTNFKKYHEFRVLFKLSIMHLTHNKRTFGVYQIRQTLYIYIIYISKKCNNNTK